MIRSLAVVSACVVLQCGCAVSQRADRNLQLTLAPAEDAPRPDAGAGDAAVRASWSRSAAPTAPAATAPPREAAMTADELAIWNSPTFRRQFMQSYLAETEIEPRVTAEERATLQKVLEQIGEEQMDRAAQLLERNRGDAASAVFDFMLANIHFQQERYDQAADLYAIAVERYPKFRRAWRNLALIHVRQSNFDQAIEALTRVLELGRIDAVTYGLLGYAYSSVEDHLAAESAYRMAILLDSETADWKMGLARSFFRQERYAEAAAFLGTLIADSPDRADLWLLQANAYIGLGKPIEAAENYEIVDHLGASTVESLNMLGDIYVNQSLFELAVEAYERAMAIDPQYDPDRVVRAAKVMAAHNAVEETRQLIGYVESRVGDRLHTEAKKDLLRLRAQLAIADGDGGEAEAEILREIVALDPLDGRALILLGRYHSRRSEPEQAIFYFERAASIPEHEADAKVEHAQVLVRQGSYAAALPLLRSAQQINYRENVQDYLEQVERLAK